MWLRICWVYFLPKGKTSSSQKALVWFGLVLWHIKHCRLFNAKSIFIHKTVLFQAIQFSMSFVCTQFKCWIVLFDPLIGPYQVLPLRWTWERWRWRVTLHSPKLQYYWSLTIRLFSVISKTLIGRVLALCRDAVVFYNPSRLGHLQKGVSWVWH